MAPLASTSATRPDSVNSRPSPLTILVRYSAEVASSISPARARAIAAGSVAMASRTLRPAFARFSNAPAASICVKL
ncbi:hypothetical protein D3C86_1452530 [compost metagenome]